MSEEKLTAAQLNEMADAILAQDDKQAVQTAEKAPEKEAEKDAEKKVSKGKLDEKTIASLPAAALINANEKLKELLIKGKKKGRLDSSDLSDVLDEMDLEGDQMDKVYDSLELLGIEVGSEDFLAELPDDI